MLSIIELYSQRDWGEGTLTHSLAKLWLSHGQPQGAVRLSGLLLGCLGQPETP